MGLPGSGKTTLATKLSKILGAIHVNADKVRGLADDWDFSDAGRIRQAERMKDTCMMHSSWYVIADFVAALPEQRDIVRPDFIIWMNTIKEGRYADTNAAFVPPSNSDHIVENFDYDIDLITAEIRSHSKA